MNIFFLNLLIDPKNNQSLILKNEIVKDDEIISGELHSNENVYKIIKGIPRFVDSKNYSNSFAYQWNFWPKIQFDSENINKPMQGWTKNMFEKITEFSNNNFKDKIFLDMGVGSGRFSDLIIKKGGIVIGVDNSNSAEVAFNNLDKSKKLLILQADILNLPIRNNILDYAFSIGVLHHTPNPYKGVSEAFRVLKENGEFAISVYEKKSYYDSRPVKFWRKIFKILKPFFGNFPPLIYSYLAVSIIWPISKISRLLSYPIRIFLPIAALPDRRWSILDTFDSLTPFYQSTHTSYEVYKWLYNIGLKNIRPSNWGSTSFIGRK